LEEFVDYRLTDNWATPSTYEHKHTWKNF
jgi:hypothetical protein